MERRGRPRPDRRLPQQPHQLLVLPPLRSRPSRDRADHGPRPHPRDPQLCPRAQVGKTFRNHKGDRDEQGARLRHKPPHAVHTELRFRRCQRAQSYIMGVTRRARKVRASTYGVVQVVSRFTSSGAPAIAGYLYEFVSLSFPFYGAGFFQFASAASMSRARLMAFY